MSPRRKQTLADYTNAEIARRTGIAASTVSRILTGARRPTLDQALAIEREFGVPCAEWAR